MRLLPVIDTLDFVSRIHGVLLTVAGMEDLSWTFERHKLDPTSFAVDIESFHHILLSLRPS